MIMFKSSFISSSDTGNFYQYLVRLSVLSYGYDLLDSMIRKEEILHNLNSAPLGAFTCLFG